MKNNIVGYFLVVICIILFGCNSKKVEEEPKTTKAPEYFLGKHLLRKMATSEEISSTDKGYSHGSFFFVLGSYTQEQESKTKSEQIVTFCWQGKDSIYTISKIPIQKMRILLNDTITSPFVTFSHFKNIGWMKNSYIHYHSEYDKVDGHQLTSDALFKIIKPIQENGSVSEQFETFVDEVMIICKPSDWTLKIQLPMQ